MIPLLDALASAWKRIVGRINENKTTFIVRFLYFQVWFAKLSYAFFICGCCCLFVVVVSLYPRIYDRWRFRALESGASYLQIFSFNCWLVLHTATLESKQQ